MTTTSFVITTQTLTLNFIQLLFIDTDTIPTFLLNDNDTILLLY